MSVLKQKTGVSFAACFVIFLIVTISKNDTCYKKAPSIVGNLQENSQKPILQSLNRMQFMADRNGTYQMRSFLYSGDDWQNLSTHRNLCLALHSSLERIHHLPNVANSFSGPISVSLFTPGTDYAQMEVFLRLVAKCYPNIMRRLSIHVIFPTKLPLETEKETDIEEMDCSSYKKLTKNFVKTKPKHLQKLTYPESRLRNLAQRGCRTPFVFVIDMDMRIPKQFDAEVESFLKNQSSICSKCVFIIPIYEINISKTGNRVPPNKTHLLKQIKKKNARIYHKKTYSLGQKMSNLDRWEKWTNSQYLQVAYELEQYQFMYEPMFIGPTSLPLFDERFDGFGFCRNTQFYETFVAGFQFKFLNNGFLIHLGFKVPGAREQWKAKELLKNQKLVPQFAKEIFARYGRDPCQMSLKLQTFPASRWKDIGCLNKKDWR